MIRHRLLATTWSRRTTGCAPAAAHTYEHAGAPARFLRDVGVLLGRDPITTPPDLAVIRAAVAFVRGGADDEDARLLWVRYAYHGAARLVGDQHPLWWQAADAYQWALLWHDLTHEVVVLCLRRVQAARFLGEPAALQIARCVLANAWHLGGQCDRADDEIGALLADGTAARVCARAGQETAVTAAVIASGCGRTDGAMRVLRVYAGYLAGMSETTRQDAAFRLARNQTAHPARCLYRPVAPAGAQAARQAVWINLLTPAPGRPADSTMRSPAGHAAYSRPRVNGSAS